MFRFTTLIAAACALAFSATSAMAASSASASITSLNFTLIDLAPQDGIAPSFSFSDVNGRTFLAAKVEEGLENEGHSRVRVGTFASDGQFLTNLPDASAQAKADGYLLSAKGSASGFQTRYEATASTGNNYTYSGGPLNLTVSANTILLIDAHVSLTASATNPNACTTDYYACSVENAYAAANLSLTYTHSPDYLNVPTYSSNVSTSLQAQARGEYTEGYYDRNPVTGMYEYVEETTPKLEQTKSLNEVLNVTFTNSTALSQSGLFGMSLNVYGRAMTASAGPSSVPEPSTYASLLAGLGALGVVRRRHQRHQLKQV